MAMQTLIPDHILEKCLNCEFLRCVKNDPNSQFKCSLCRSKLGMGGGLGLLSPSHQIDLTVRQCEGREGLVNLATITEKIEADYIRGLIGFSTVCLPERVKFDDKLNVYWRVQATVLELCFPTPAKLLAFAPTKEKIVLIKKLAEFPEIIKLAKEKKTLEGQGAANAIKAELDARTDGMKKMAEDLKVDGKDIVGAETARKIGESPSTKIVLGTNGFSELISAGATIAKNFAQKNP